MEPAGLCAASGMKAHPGANTCVLRYILRAGRREKILGVERNNNGNNDMTTAEFTTSLHNNSLLAFHATATTNGKEDGIRP